MVSFCPLLQGYACKQMPYKDAIFVFQMTEKEFWTKYSRAEYLHSTKNVVAAAAEAAEDEELAVFLKRDDMLANEARRKVVSFAFCFLLDILRLNVFAMIFFISDFIH